MLQMTLKNLFLKKQKERILHEKRNTDR